MWHSLIFYHWYLIPYSVSVSRFRIPCFSAAQKMICGGGGGGGKLLNFIVFKTILMPIILTFSQSTFYSWGADISWFCSVCKKSSSRKDSMQRHTTMLVSHHFKPFRFHRNVSGFDSSILLPPWLQEWPAQEKRPGFDLYCSKLQRQFTLPRRGLFGVIHNGSLRIQKC